MFVNGFNTDELSNGIDDFEMSPNNPIPCETILGSVIYLENLRTLNGDKVLNERIGSFKSDITPYYVDGYQIYNLNRQKITVLYFPLYQKRNSRKAPKGFKLTE